MKITRLPLVALALIAGFTMFVGTAPADAQVAIQIGGGGPPPPPHFYHERRWATPGPGAVWIHGDNVWRDGHWAYVGGYWSYPPYPGGFWVYGHYRHGYWHPGHWAR